MSVLSRRYFHDEAAAFEHVEATLWPKGPVCPSCGNMDDRFKGRIKEHMPMINKRPQHEKFNEAVRELKTDQSEEAFDRTVKDIAKRKPRNDKANDRN